MKSSCVAASAAQLFAGLSVAESFVDGLGSGRLQNFGKLLSKYISKRDVALMVKAAGDNGTVAKNADLIAESIAEDMIPCTCSAKIRPVKLVAMLQIYVLTDTKSIALRYPIFREITMKRISDLCVQFIQTAMIPQPVAN